FRRTVSPAGGTMARTAARVSKAIQDSEAMTMGNEKSSLRFALAAFRETQRARNVNWFSFLFIIVVALARFPAPAGLGWLHPLHRPAARTPDRWPSWPVCP